MTELQAPNSGEFLLYETEDGRTRVECRFVEDSLWLTQALMAELFQVKVPTINEHLKTLYADGEIQPEATIRKFLIVRQEGARRVSRSIDHYNLIAILAVGEIAPTAQVTTQVTEQVQRLLVVLVGELSRQQLLDALGMTHREHFRSVYLKPALDAGMVEMTIPAKPNSSHQRYRRTALGQRWLEAHSGTGAG